MTKKLAFPSGICYNNSNKMPQAEPYPEVKVVPDAKRTQKNSNYRRRKASHSLWCNIPNSLVLQKTKIYLKKILIVVAQFIEHYRQCCFCLINQATTIY